MWSVLRIQPWPYNNGPSFSSHYHFISGLMVLLAGRYLVQERPHMLEYILLNFLTNWSQDIEWRNLSMQHAVKTCEYIQRDNACKFIMKEVP